MLRFLAQLRLHLLIQMASIQSLGVGSGLLTTELVEDIMAAEREGTQLRLDARRAEFEAKISAFGAIQNKIDTLAAAARSMGDASALLSYSAASTNESAVTATASSSARPGIHTVEVLATARAHTLTTIRYDSVDEIVGEGTLDFRFGTTTFDGGNYDSFTENADRASAQVTIDSSNSTLSGVRDAINAADIGVAASIVNDGQGFVLVLQSSQTGEDHSMEIVATEGTVAGLSALAFNSAENTPGTNMTQTVDADDAMVTIDGITITRETNTIDEVIEGVTFNALGNNAGSPATISIGQDLAAMEQKMQAFVDAYNDVKALNDELTDYDEKKEQGGLLSGDATMRNVMAQLQRFLRRSVTNLESQNVRALVDLGISTNQNINYMLEFSGSAFRDAMAASSGDVLALLAQDRRASDTQIEFYGAQTITQAGAYDVEITQAGTQASYSGSAVAGLAGPIVVDDDNDTLSMTVDGISSGTITLAQGSYATGAELATELQTQINADSALRAAGSIVEVTYDATNQQLVLRSTQFGSASNIGIDSVDTDTLADFGLDVVSHTSNLGTNVEGTVNGVSGIGTGQFLVIPGGAVAATSGVYEGQSISTFGSPPLTIDATNDTFAVSVDGTNTADIVLTNGDYATAAELAAEIQSQINADSTLASLERSVSVSFDASNSRFEITSDRTGPNSRVSVVSASAGVVSDLGLSVAAGEPGKSASTQPDAAAGIQLRVQGETIGDRGTVTFVRGVMNQIESFLEELTSVAGRLTNKVDTLAGQVAEIDQEEIEFERRMNAVEDRLRFQFAAADALILTLNNTSSFLDRQLDSLPGYNRSD